MSRALQKFDAIIVDPDYTSRMRLRQATAAVPTFGEVNLTPSINDALGKLGLRKHCDVIFLSNNLGTADITSFIKNGKAIEGGQDAAYVLVLSDDIKDKSVVANYVMHGTDGFLFAPYSVDSLVDITKLAAQVRKERSAAREKAALKLLISDLVNQIDIVALLRSNQCSTAKSAKKLQELATNIKNLPTQAQESYFEVLTELFIAAPVPKKSIQAKMYSGASARIKKKMAEKLAAEMEAATEVAHKDS